MIATQQTNSGHLQEKRSPAKGCRRSAGRSCIFIFAAQIDPHLINIKRNQHVVPTNSGWAVRGAGNERRTSIHDTQAKAIAIARDIARNQHSELLIHGRNGQIRSRYSYGNDSCPPPG